MFKKTLALLLTAFMVFSMAACGNASSQEENNQSTDNASTQEQTETADTASTSESADSTSAIGTVANTLAEDEDTLIATYADKFDQKTYSDSESGLSITYNVYLPEGYDASASYPMVVFIGDSSCAGNDAAVSLTQGRGGLVWATGTIEPRSSGMGGSGAPSGGFGGPGGSDNSGEKPSGGFGGPGGNGDSSGMSGGPSGGTDSSSYHMASFDYAYNCVAVMEWLFRQSK